MKYEGKLYGKVGKVYFPLNALKYMKYENRKTDTGENF